MRLVGHLQCLTGGFDADMYAFELEPEHVGPLESLVLRHYRSLRGQIGRGLSRGIPVSYNLMRRWLLESPPSNAVRSRRLNNGVGRACLELCSRHVNGALVANA